MAAAAAPPEFYQEITVGELNNGDIVKHGADILIIIVKQDIGNNQSRIVLRKLDQINKIFTEEITLTPLDNDNHFFRKVNCPQPAPAAAATSGGGSRRKRSTSRNRRKLRKT